MWPFASPAPLRAAPVLLRRRPSAEEVVQRRLAVEGVLGGRMDLAAGLLDGAPPAHVALHLDLAVGQFAAVLLAAEDVVMSPFDAVDALGALIPLHTHGIAFQLGQRGVGAALLELPAAPAQCQSNAVSLCQGAIGALGLSRT